MASLSQTLGLSPSPPLTPIHSLVPSLLIFNFLHAYIFMSTRGIKRHYNLDHNVSPREDVMKYGEEMVKKGVLTRRQLERVKRWEGAHANLVEGFALVVGSSLLGLHAGVPTQTLNGLMALYTASRVVYGVAYIFTETERWSWFRTACFWTGNICCLRMMWLAGKRL